MRKNQYEKKDNNVQAADLFCLYSDCYPSVNKIQFSKNIVIWLCFCCIRLNEVLNINLYRGTFILLLSASSKDRSDQLFRKARLAAPRSPESSLRVER